MKIAWYLYLVLVAASGAADSDEDAGGSSETTLLPSTDDNVPNATAENVSSLSSAATTSLTTGPSPTTEKTTSKPKKKKDKNKDEEDEWWRRMANLCTCDLTDSSCDPGCCCDQDCDGDKAAAFSGCDDDDIGDDVDPGYCFTTEFIYANNTQISVERVSPSLLCLKRDNFPEHALYLDRAPVENVTQFDMLQSRHKRFRWPEARAVARKRNEVYLAGDPVLVYRAEHDEFSYLSLPGRFGSDCLVWDPVRYMEDGEVECAVSLADVTDCRKVPGLDAGGMVTGFAVVRTPASGKNASRLERRRRVTNSDGDRVFAEMKVLICKGDNDDDGPEKCSNHDVTPSPTLDCDNVVTEVRLEMHHAGLGGVHRVVARVRLEDFGGAGHADAVVRQKFGYEHFWTSLNATATASNNDTSMKRMRSGNPGYIAGKPLIVGEATTETASEKVEVSVDSWRRLSLMPLLATGECFAGSGQRTALTFGDDMRVGCTFPISRSTLSSSCAALRKGVLHLLVGSEEDPEALLGKVRVGAYGNAADADNAAEWVPVLVENSPSEKPGQMEKLESKSSTEVTAAGPSSSGVCPDMVLSSHFEVVYALTGSAANPQPKVVGVKVRFGAPVDVRVDCDAGDGACIGGASTPITQQVAVTSTVSFLDVTASAAEPAMAEFPVIEAKFPHDFFYPFVVDDVAKANSGSVGRMNGPLLVFTAAVGVTILYHFRT